MLKLHESFLDREFVQSVYITAASRSLGLLVLKLSVPQLHDNCVCLKDMDSLSQL